MDWLSLIIGFILGIIASLIGNWGYFQITKRIKRNSHKDYFTSTVDGNIVTFEGQFSGKADMGHIARRFLENIGEPDDSDKS